MSSEDIIKRLLVWYKNCNVDDGCPYADDCSSCYRVIEDIDKLLKDRKKEQCDKCTNGICDTCAFCGD